MPDRESAPPDPYEYGFDVAQRKRLPLPGIDEEPPDEQPDEKRRRRLGNRDVWKWLIGAVAIFTAVAIGRGIQANRINSLSPDCTRAQVKVAETSIGHGGLLHWSATAAAGVRFVVGVNASTVTVNGAVASAVPAAGSAGQASRVTTMSKDCLARGQFGVLLPAGSYPVTLFRLDATGAAAAVARATVTVR